MLVPFIKFVIFVYWLLQLLPPLQLRKTSLQALLKKIHEAKLQKVYGKNLFNTVIEPAINLGVGADVSPPVRNMLW